MSSATSGSGKTNLCSTFKDLPKLSLPALAPVQVNIRTVTLYRSISGDFGFLLRRTQIPDQHGKLKAVTFVEPKCFRIGPPRPTEIRCGIIPGDQLLRINGTSVDSLSRNELATILEKSGSAVELTVKARPEFAELCDRTLEERREAGDSLVLPAIIKHRTISNASDEDGLWLIHENGFTLGHFLEARPDGRIKIKVMDTEMIVDITDVDKANPAELDRVKDLFSLPYINETSTLHVLRQRYGSNLCYTYAGPRNLICFSEQCPPGMISLFKGCRRREMPPHIYASAQQAYRVLQTSGRNRSIILTGVTGSGKSTQLRNICRYYCEVAGWRNSLSYEVISAVLTVMNSFGNCCTEYNKSATRFLQMLSLSFDSAASLRSARVQIFLVESTRILCRKTTESTFFVVTYLLLGADVDTLKKLRLSGVDPNISKIPGGEDAQISAQDSWAELMQAFTCLGFSEQEKTTVISVLAAIIHLLCAEATQGQAQRSHFIRVQNAQHAATLLGLDIDQLAAVVFRRNASLATASNSASRLPISSRNLTGQEALERFVSCLYNELFGAVVGLVNRFLSRNSTPSLASITIVDYPGSNFAFHNEDEKHSRGLTDLLYNYVNERIAELHYDECFMESLEAYKREQIDADIEPPQNSPHQLTRLIDQKQQLSNCVDIELRSREKRGLMCILDEEALFPAATDDSFFERIFVHLSESNLIKRHTQPLIFNLRHGLGSCPIAYSVDGWVKRAQACYANTSLLPLLCKSSNTTMASIFSPGVPCGNEQKSMKMRKATQTVKLDAAGLHVTSKFFADVCLQLDYIVSTVKRTAGLHFVHCIKPLFSNVQKPYTEELFDIGLVRRQLRSLSIVETTHANKKGYPERIPYKYFRCHFRCLSSEQKESTEYMDDRAAAGHILESSGAYSHLYQLGLSQVFLRSNLLDVLEQRREMCLTGLIAHFQQLCRKCLARRWIAKRRVQEIAIKCIQRNGRVYAKVREWPWWRLYTRVSPLLLAARSDLEIREWQQKLEEKDSLINDLRMKNGHLASRIAELEEMLSIEQSNAQSIAVLLERETDQRLHNEKQLIVQQRMHDESRSSGSCSLHSFIGQNQSLDSKVPELQNEIAELKESVATQRARTQKALQQLRDVESELKDVRAEKLMLEKKYKSFDVDLQRAKDECAAQASEKAKALLAKDEVVTASNRLFSELQSLKTENGELRQNIAKLRKELQIENISKDGDAENEIMSLQKLKRTLEARCSEQEEEIEELIGKAKQLEQTVTRLEMSNEKTRNDRLRDLDVKDAEISEMRAQFQRRIRTSEEQVADLQEVNLTLLKQNRVLEERSRDMDSCSCSVSSGHYKRDLKKALTLLRDTQQALSRERENTVDKAVLRQLQEQLMDAEASKLSALKSRHSLETEINELKIQLEAALSAKKAAEDKALVLLKEKSSALALVEEQDEQMQKLLKKYKEVVQQSAMDSIKITDQYEQMSDLEKDRNKIREQLNDLSSAFEYYQQHSVEKHKYLLAEQKIRDLENKVEVEISQRMRHEALQVKMNDEIESLRDQIKEISNLRDKEASAVRKVRREITAVQEQLEDVRKRETDLAHRVRQSASEREKAEIEKESLAKQLESSEKRIEVLQAALSSEISDDDDSSEVDDLSLQNGSLTGIKDFVNHGCSLGGSPKATLLKSRPNAALGDASWK